MPFLFIESLHPAPGDGIIVCYPFTIAKCIGSLRPVQS